MGHKRYPKSSILWTGKRRRNGKRMDWNCISCLKPRAFGPFSEAHGLFFARLEFCENYWRSVFLVENLNFRWEKKGWREETVKISKFGRETVKKPLFGSGSKWFRAKIKLPGGNLWNDRSILKMEMGQVVCNRGVHWAGPVQAEHTQARPSSSGLPGSVRSSWSILGSSLSI